MKLSENFSLVDITGRLKQIFSKFPIYFVIQSIGVCIYVIYELPIVFAIPR